jgi:3-oxoacyl-[acyl-carrier protein] reductase
LLENQEEEMRMSKDGLCAIVTGSASGLGAATVAILAQGADARIVVNYSSSANEAEQTADLCRKAGAEVVVVQGDVSRDEDCRKIVAAAATWGRLDALVNNAGKHTAHENLDGLSAEDFQRLYGVNTIGPFQMVRAARTLLEAGAKASGGMAAVVNVSSVAGITGIGSSIAYAASKGALNTMTLLAGAGARAADPRQHRMPRLHRHALVHQGTRRRRRGQDTRFRSRQGATEARLYRRRGR